MSIEILKEDDTGCFKSIEEFYEWYEKFNEFLIEHIGEVANAIAGAVVEEMSSKDFESALEELEDKSIYTGTCKTGEIINDTPLADYQLPKELREILDGKRNKRSNR